jgi:broad specificity phosphatase PhoE
MAREVHVLRHAPRNISGQLTEEGKRQAQSLKGKLGKYHKVISSEMPRAQETAILITGEPPHIDKRAGIPAFTEEQERALFELGKIHPHGIAGVIFDTPEYRELVKIRGKTLAELIKETLTNLPENARALIITHDGSMVGAEKILTNQPFDTAGKYYKPLSGYKVNEQLEIEELTI